MKSWPCAALAGASLAGRTTIQVGGSVEWLLEPRTPEELRQAVVAAREFLRDAADGRAIAESLEPRILGGGANLIVADGVLPGIVIATDRMQRVFRPGSGVSSEESLREIAPDDRMAPQSPKEDARIVAWAGSSMPRIVSATQKLGWTGFEGLVGVPGNVGGGIAMNAGGRWGEMWDVVERVLLVAEDGTFVEKAREECRPTYRNGQLARAIVASAVLRFRPDEKAAVVERCRDYLKQKKDAQPVTERSAGCVWKNPDREKSGGLSAGRLVEQCGGKEMSRGDAIVSHLHGNFIVNRGKATATDVLTLIEDVHDLVAQKTGISLEREVKVWM